MSARFPTVALEICEDICARADAMGLGLVKFDVADVRAITSYVRQGALRAAAASPASAPSHRLDEPLPQTPHNPEEL